MSHHYIEESALKDCVISDELEHAFRMLIDNSVLQSHILNCEDGDIEYVRIEDRLYILNFTVKPEQD